MPPYKILKYQLSSESGRPGRLLERWQLDREFNGRITLGFLRSKSLQAILQVHISQTVAYLGTLGIWHLKI